jgi:hypothetical protein
VSQDWRDERIAKLEAENPELNRLRTDALMAVLGPYLEQLLERGFSRRPRRQRKFFRHPPAPRSALDFRPRACGKIVADHEICRDVLSVT